MLSLHYITLHKLCPLVLILSYPAFCILKLCLNKSVLWSTQCRSKQRHGDIFKNLCYIKLRCMFASLIRDNRILANIAATIILKQTISNQS